MNHSLSRPYEPNFMSIVPRWQLLWTKTPLKESSNVIQLFHACSANFILGTMKGSNLFLQKRRECSGRSKYWAWEIQAPFCDEPWRRRIKHFLSTGPKFFSLRVPNWRRRCPRPKAGAPRPFSVLQPFLPSRLIKHDLCPPLPLARIYCTASIRKFWKYQSVFPKYQSLCLQSSLLIGSAEAYLKISRNRIKILFLS